MNLNIRVRNIQFALIEGMLKVHVLSTGPGCCHFPEGLQILTENKGFTGQIDRLPKLQQGQDGAFLAFDCYSLLSPELVPQPSGTSQWLSIPEVQQLSASNAALIDQTLKRLQQELNFQPIAYHLLPTIFTMQELSSLYEQITGNILNRGNFYRKMKNLKALEHRGIQRNGKAHKSPILYAFAKDYLQQLQQGLLLDF